MRTISENGLNRYIGYILHKSENEPLYDIMKRVNTKHCDNCKSKTYGCNYCSLYCLDGLNEMAYEELSESIYYSFINCNEEHLSPKEYITTYYNDIDDYYLDCHVEELEMRIKQ